MILDSRSCSSVLVDLYSSAPPSIGLGTGFLLADSGDLLLVTNYHVLSGRHAETNEPIDPHARIPDRVLVPVPTALTASEAPTQKDAVALLWRGTVWKLEDDEGVPLWVTHPNKGRRVDVAVLPLGKSALLGHREKCAYPLEQPDLAVQFGSSVAIIGFPDRLPTATLTAIWKGGYIASEPEIDVALQPFFWLDAAGAPGMSGSPVITRQSGPLKAVGGSVALGLRGNLDRIVGVYAGRANADTSLGRCWRWDAVAEVIRSALSKVRSGALVPQQGQLGCYARPDDVRVPRIAEDGRYLTLLAGEFAAGIGDNLQALRTAAVLRAALENAAEPESIVLPRENAEELAKQLERLPSNPRNAALLAALRAKLHARQ